MKTKLFLASIFSFLLLLVGCNTPIVPTITINPATISLYVGDTYTLTATIEPAGTVATINWTSSEPEVAIVDAYGQVVALSEGTTTITASAEGITSANCQIIVENIPSSFPRKFLIEHFTGDQCGYCPGGMYAIVEHIASATTPYIWVSHHYGYNQDEYTIPENSKIGKMLGVSGAPNMALNRTKQKPGLAFHPGYLPEITIQDDTVAEASVVIKHTFNTETRQLDMTVSGHVGDTTITNYLLSVLIKENRLVGKQADYQYSWKTATWKEYMHARVVRAFVTAHFGDTIQVKNQAYTHTLTYTINNEWIPENCCVVAYLTPLSKKPIINAEQVPLVAGTTGGEQYNPYGITEGKGPNTSVTFDSIALVKLADNLLEVQLYSKKSIKTNFGSSKPIGLVHLNTNDTTLQAGTYPIQEDNAIGTISIGYRIDEKATLGGSILMYASTNDLKKDIITPFHQWRMQSGNMIVGEDGSITLDFKTYNGTSVKTTYGIVAE